MRTAPLLLSTLLATPALAAPPPPPAPTELKVSLSAQELARVRVLSDDLFDGDPDGTVRVGNRARAGLGLEFRAISAFIQIQDVRFWGTEVAPDGGEGTLRDFSADGFDMHQAWGQITAPDGFFLRIGRQEVTWHGKRLIAAPAFALQGRSFDGVRAVFEGDDVGAEAFYALLLDRPTGPDDPATRNQNMHLVAGRGGPRLGDALSLDGVIIARLDPGRSEAIATVGAHAKGKAGPLSWWAEGYAQVGTRAGADVAAGLFGARAGATIAEAANLYLGGGVDLVSGDSDPADGVISTFDTLYAANHKFYGHIDRYLNLPRDTLGLGLVDGVFNVSVVPVEPLTISVDLHVFGGPWAEEDVRFHGVELDTGIAIRPVKPLTIRGGFWVYVPGPFLGPDDLEPEVAGMLEVDFLLR